MRSASRRYLRPLRSAVSVAFLTFIAQPAASEAPSPAALCHAATAQAEEAHNLPAGLLRAISLVESGRRVDGKREAWPWTINLEGKGFWFDSRAEALAFAKKALAQGKTSFDVGCMQVNFRWHGEHFASVEDMFDPFANADYAARFLGSLHAETGDWMRAASYYHSRTPKHAKRYKGLVATAYAEARADKRARAQALTRPASLERAFAEAKAKTPPSAPPPPGPRKAQPERGSWPSFTGGAPLLASAAAPPPEPTPAQAPSKGGLALRMITPAAAPGRPTKGGLLRGAKPLF